MKKINTDKYINNINPSIDSSIHANTDANIDTKIYTKIDTDIDASTDVSIDVSTDSSTDSRTDTNSESKMLSIKNKIVEHFNDPLNIVGTIKDAVSGPFDEVKEFFLKIPKLFKPILDILDSIKNFFKNFIAGFDFSDFNKMAAAIATIIIPFFGQLYARINYLDGSLDLPFLFLFATPPLSIVPAIAILFKVIKKGKGGKPYDTSILLPVFVNIFCETFLSIFLDGLNLIFVKYFLMLISLFATYYIKSLSECENKPAPISHILRNALVTKILFTVLPIVLPYVPKIGLIFKLFQKIPFFGTIINQILALFLIYILLNMINSSNTDDFCKDSSDNFKINIGLAIFSIGIAYFSTKLDNIIANATANVI